jgi:hypothetical protein
MTREHDGLGIKTAAGRQIYDRARERSGRIQLERAKHKMGSREFERLTKEDVSVMREGLAEALALNPKTKTKRTLKPRTR